MASSFYVFSTLADYRKYYGNYVSNEEYSNEIDRFLVNKDEDKTAFISRHRDITVPTVLGSSSLKAILLPQERYDYREYIEKYFSEYDFIEEFLEEDEVRWKRMNDGGIIEFRRNVWFKLLGLHLFRRKITYSRVYTQKTVGLVDSPNKWHLVRQYFYDKFRNRVCMVLDL